MPPMQNEATLVGVADAAEVLGLSVDTVKRAARSGQLAPAIKMPGKTGAYLFRREDVEQFAAQRATGRAA